MEACCDLARDRRVVGAAVVASAVIAIPWMTRKVACAIHRVHLRKKAEELRNARDESIEWARSTANTMDMKERERIAKMDDQHLTEALQSGSITAVDALKTFLGLAVAAHERTNCVTLFLTDSLAVAEEWDAKYKDSTFEKPPLFGLPISVKESTPMAGHLCTWGYASCPFPPCDRDHLVVACAKINGAIPFVRTNVPMTLLAFDSINAIYGATTNPHSRERSSGGSSGGESAMVGCHGATMGIGSDIGGSVRVPAAYCGIAGFKPTGQRVSTIGYPIQLQGVPCLSLSDGVLAQSMETCANFMKLFWKCEDLFAADTTVPPIPWQEDLFKEGRKYTIGYWTQDQWLQAVPSQVRAVEKAKSALEAAGHTVVPFTMPGPDDVLMSNYLTLLYANGGADLCAIFDNELTPSEFSNYRSIVGYSPIMKRLRGFLFHMLGWKRNAIQQLAFPRTSVDLQRAMHWTLDYRMLVVEEMRKAGVDALLCPPTYTPAISSGTLLRQSIYIGMPTIRFNLLEFPAGIVKVTTFSEADERAMNGYEPTCAEERVFKKDFENGARGLPVGVQIAAPSFRDEIALRILCDLEKSLGKNTE